MTIRLLSLAILLTGLLFLRFLLKVGSKVEISQSEILGILNIEDAENRLALGFKLSLSNLDREDLEYISGLSEASKLKILEMRDEILVEARALPEKKKHEALLKVKGIGKKKASAISEIISMD